MMNPPRNITLPPQDLAHPAHPTSCRHSCCQQESRDQKAYQPTRNSQYPSPTSAMEAPRSADTSHGSLPSGSPVSPNEPVYKYASASSSEASPRAEYTYSLKIVQQPIHSRMVGSGDKADRRPLDPPPVLKFEVSQSANASQSSVDLTLLRSPYFMCYCTLCEATAPYKELYGIPHTNKSYMVGSIVSSMFQLRAGKKTSGITEGHYFVFHDVGVRVEGAYRFKFSVYEIVDRKVYLCKSTMSEKFRVYPAKSFPGMDTSTDISNLFASQGMRMRVRTKNLNVPVLNENFKAVAAGSKKTQRKRRISEDDSEKAISPRHPVQPPQLASDNQPHFYPFPPAIKSLSPPQLCPRLEGNRKKMKLPSVEGFLKGEKPESVSRNSLWLKDPPSR
ncbi:hypothetical protein PTTG_01921 [Puccinia triticina 1-1 BBBD Race 1]|uniref:Velvet domain-containing protein n=2 Tax=Puccinia triticina TaxID=208348 RepID=A0A180GY01_PUCT1|nr:uncharacterized protein PtA15_1A585 [Puccinia triticina]OAV97610.1 hypothetical protein PTTG_01921 [Puccinia triticina 1-1 BBBD Race 1]WAQ81245.1 hypothetical protein PtA15_1A585 [Puccinia triticina]